MKRILILLFSNIGIKFLIIVYGIISTRLLGPEKKGLYTLILLLPNLLISFSDLGIGQSAVFYLRNKTYKPNEIFSSFLFISIFLSIIIPLLVVLFKPIFNLIFPLITENKYYLLAVGLYPILLLQSYSSIFLLANDKVKVFSIIMIMRDFLSLLVVVYLYIYDVRDVLILLIVYLLMNLLSTVAMLIILNRAIHFSIQSISKNVILNLIKFGSKFNILSIIQWISYKSNYILIGLFLEASELGIFAVAVAISDLIFMISSAASNIIYIDRASGISKDHQGINRIYLNIKIVIYMMAILGAIILIIGKPAINTLYTTEFLSASALLKILIPGNIIFSVYKLYGNTLAAGGSPGKLLIISIYFMISSVIFNLIFIPIFGIRGAAVATTLSYFIASIITIEYVKKRDSVTLREMFIINREELKYIFDILKKKKL